METEVNGIFDPRVILRKLHHVFEKYPFLRGMLSYAITWPLCSLTQEFIEHGKTFENADWARAGRFFIFGTLFMSPIYYNWSKYTSSYFKGNNMTTAITRAVVERLTFAPFGLSYFFFVMSLLEGQSLGGCVKEVREKFWPTFKVGCLYWPTAQAINFYFFSESNRLLFRSFSSFIWTVFLGHVKAQKRRRGSHARGRGLYYYLC